MKYDVTYFINKFEAIPENLWCMNDFQRGDAMCANGHCGLYDEFTVTDESEALKQLFSMLPLHYYGNGYIIEEVPAKYSVNAAFVNDGRTEEYRQPTPKQRILAALYDIKKMQFDTDTKYAKDIDTGGKTKTVYVAVPVTITEQAKELVMS